MRSLRLTFAAAVLGFGLMASHALAQTASAILVMDEGRVFSTSDAGKSALAQLKAIGDQITTELDTERKSLAAERDRIGQQRATLTQDQLKARVAALEKRAANFEKIADTKGKEMEATRANTIKTLNTALQPVLEEIVKARGATILLDKGNLIYASGTLEITDEVITKLNGRLRPFTVVRVRAPAAAAATPRPVTPPAAAR
jgi:Skp family chaperone for outer membrane proteins